ncbi:MAG: hypothetical protein RIS64_3696 [Bacteroidota bacterium]|jgi:hypothetical protein
MARNYPTLQKKGVSDAIFMNLEAVEAYLNS